MSDIRFNSWLHQSGTGGVHQDGSGNIGIGTTQPVGKLEVAGSITANGFTGNVTGDVNAGVITATSSIVVGNSFINPTSIGIGATTNSGRNAGVSTAIGTLIFNSDLGSIQVYNGNAWYKISQDTGIVATGGVIGEYESGGTSYRTHSFVNSGILHVTSAPPSAEVDYLVIGGGGSGGWNQGGGGGAGGFRAGNSLPISKQDYTITVGAGGAAKTRVGTTNQGSTGSSGASSTFSTITSSGGGGGGGSDNGLPVATGQSGGSAGGGASFGSTIGPGGTGTVGQGNDGGDGSTDGATYRNGGGGGGAGGNGTDAAPGQAGPGGNGSTSSITGSSVTYAGGGGGGSAASGNAGTAGAGGGGAGGPSASGNAENGSPATGGGGGGNGNIVVLSSSGSGGSGLVVVRYVIESTKTAKATGGIISYEDGKTIHTFYSSGNFQVTSPELTSVEYLGVAGGGGGGGKYNDDRCGTGGGGAGGFRLSNNLPVAVTTYNIVVGAGGRSGYNATPTNPSSAGRGFNGSNTTISNYPATVNVVATGGGGGGAWNSPDPSQMVGASGGSGGGGSEGPGTASGGSGTDGQGNPGGTGGTYPSYAGGGGGAGAPGIARHGGDGLMYMGKYYAGGGGGCDYFIGDPPPGAGPYQLGQGGLGGGGNAGFNGERNTGGGSGGAGEGSRPLAPNEVVAGGSGIVIISYPT